MIYLSFLLIIVPIPCLSVETNQNPLRYRPAPAPSPIGRWIELYRLMHEPSSTTINLNQLDTILHEMSKLEQTEAFRIGLLPFDELLGIRINHYESLVCKAHEANFIINPDATVTNILLQTVERDSNDCTSEFFDLLEEIYETFRLTAITNALQENRALIHRDCWQRLMNISRASSRLLGSRIKTPLNALSALVYPYQNGIVKPTDLAKPSLEATENDRISKIIVEFLSFLKQTENFPNYRIAFEHFVEYPCKSLINETKYLMHQVYSLLKFCYNMPELITKDDAIRVNRYMFCTRINADSETIRSKVLQLIGESSSMIKDINDERHIIRDNLPKILPIQDGMNRSESSLQIPLSIDNSRSRSNPRWFKKTLHKPTSDEISQINQFNIIDSSSEFNDINLITQHVPSELDDLSLVEPSSSADIIQSEPAAKRQKNTNNIIEDDDNLQDAENLVEHQSGSECSKKVIEVLKGFGRGIYVAYLTKWSDGTTTMENKAFLEDNWPGPYLAFIKKRNAAWANANPTQNDIHVENAAILVHDDNNDENLLEKSPLPPIGNPEDRRLIKIGRVCSGSRGRTFVTYWSDGTRTEETRAYLMSHWPLAWIDHVNQVRAVRNKKKNKAQ